MAVGDTSKAADFQDLLRQASTTGRADPFLLNFLFAMGELSGQVKSLASEVANLRKERADDAAERRQVEAAMQADIDALKGWQKTVMAIAAGVGAVVTFIGEWLVNRL